MAKQIDNNVPLIRFEGFEDEWVEQKLKDIVEVYSGRDYKHLSVGDIPVYGTGGYMLSVDEALSYDQDAIGIGRKGTINKPYLLKCPFWTVDTLFYAVPREGYDLNFSFCIFQKTDWKKKDESTGVPSLSRRAINETRTFTPNENEQHRISLYFKEFDRVIELHQHKHNKLVTLKQAMLQKMFPQDGATTPEIRFKGFAGGWSVTRLGDITLPLSNNTLSRENLNKKSGLARNIHYGDILVWLGEVVDVNRNELPFITDSLLVSKLQSSKLRDGDIIIADAAEDSTVGKTTEVLNVGSELVFAGLHTIALRPMISFAPAYLGYFMNSHSFHDQLLPIMQGTKVLSVSKTALKEMHLLYPKELEEQQKIGNYFRKLDELISQHSTQLNKLKQIKSACLEKMFV